MKKKFTSMILTLILSLLLLFITASADAEFFPITEITENLSIDKSEYTNISLWQDVFRSYGTVQQYITPENLSIISESFSKNNLIHTGEKQNTAIGNWEGSYSFSFTLNDNNNESIRIAFDKSKVVYTKIYSDKFEIYQGIFNFKNNDTYEKLMKIVNSLIEQFNQNDPRKNLININNIKILYSASFPHNMAPDSVFSWGLCSYIRDGKTTTDIHCYYSIMNEPEVKIFIISDDFSNNNIIYFDNARAIQYSNNNTYGEEYDMEGMARDYTLHLTVNENMQVENLIFTHQFTDQNYPSVDKTPISDNIDMDFYKQSGTLPSELFEISKAVDMTSTESSEAQDKSEVDKEAETKKEEPKTPENVTEPKTPEISTEQKIETTEKNTETKQEEKAEINEEQKPETNIEETKAPETTEKNTEEEKTEEQKSETEVKSETTEEAVSKEIFLDVPKDHWAYNEIYEFYEKGIILGYGNGYFGVDDSITYEHFAILLNRLFSYKAENTSSVPAIREDVIASVVKALKLDTEESKAVAIENIFNDCGNLKEENKSYIARAIYDGLVIGYDGKLFPKDKLTRAETVVLLSRAIKNK